MRIGIVGPSDTAKTAQIVGQKAEAYLKIVRECAKAVAADKSLEIVIVPHKGSASWNFAKAYRAAGGRKIRGVAPEVDSEFGTEYLDRELCDEIIDAGNWRSASCAFAEHSDAFLCLGFSAGVLAELGNAKWFGGKRKTVVLRQLVSAEMPKEAVKHLEMVYVKTAKEAVEALLDWEDELAARKMSKISEEIEQGKRTVLSEAWVKKKYGFK